MFSSFLLDGHFYVTPASELLFVWKSHYDRFIGFLALIPGKQVLASGIDATVALLIVLEAEKEGILDLLAGDILGKSSALGLGVCTVDVCLSEVAECSLRAGSEKSTDTESFDVEHD